MRIGIDGRALQGTPRGGVGQYTFNLLHALFKLDRENEYVVWYNCFGKIVVPEFSEYKNVRIRRTYWPNKILNVGMRLSSIKSPMSDVDVFFMPNLNFISLAVSIKLILVVHDLSFEHFPEHFSLKSRLWYKAIGPRAFLKRADQIIAVSRHTKGDLVETYGIVEEKVAVIYPGVNNCHPEAAAEGSRTLTNGILRTAQNDNSGSYILYFGALEPRKNIEGIISAYEMLKPREALILAGLSTPYVWRLKKRIAKSRLRDQIILKENPTEDEKEKLYAGARLFVYPSFYEGFGFPPLEAMAAGVPVVASSASSVPEICGDAALLVSPWKVEEIKQGMRILLEDEEARKYCIAAGYKRVKEFSWDKCAREVLEMFKGVVL